MAVGAALSFLLIAASAVLAEPDERVAVLAMRPTSGPEAYATRLDLLPEASALRQTIENAVVASSGREAAPGRQVQRLLGSKYVISLYDCGGRVACVESLLKPLKTSSIATVVDGDYYESEGALLVRLRFFDTRHGKLKSAVDLRVPLAQRGDLGAWTQGITPVFQDTGAVTVLVNVPDAVCELDGKPCELDVEDTIAAIPEGEHQLLLRAPGYGDEQKTIVVRRGEGTRVDVTLKRLNTQGLEPYQQPITEVSPALSAIKEGLAPLVEINGGIEPSWAYVFRGPLPQPLKAKSSFYLRRVFVSFSGSLQPWVGYRMSLEFGQFQLEDAPLSGPLRDAHLWLRYGGQELRVGQFRVPFGWERYNTAISLPVAMRSLITPRLTTEYGRDIGIGVFGTIELGEHWRIEDSLALVNGSGVNQLDIDGRKDLAARLGVAYDKLFFAGLSGETVEVVREDGTREDTKRFGADVRLESRYVFAVLETAYAVMTAPIDTHQFGGFVIVLARLPLDMELGARLELMDPNTRAAGNERRITGLFKWEFIRDQLMLIVNYEHAFTPILWQQQSILEAPLPGSDVLRVAMRIRF